MPSRTPKKVLLTGESGQTIGLAGLALACVGVMLVGGIFVAIGLIMALGCCGVIVGLHWREMWAAIKAGRVSRHAILPVTVSRQWKGYWQRRAA